MRPLTQCRVASESAILRDVLSSQGHRQRRTGATMLVDSDGCLSGIFTDSDLVRRISTGESLPLDQPVSQVMTGSPKSAPTGCRLSVALEILTKHKISELPIVDADERPVGLIDVTDVIELLPQESIETEPEPTAQASREPLRILPESR